MKEERYHPNEHMDLWIGKMIARQRRIGQAPVENFIPVPVEPKRVDKEDEIGYVTDEWADNSQPVCSE